VDPKRQQQDPNQNSSQFSMDMAPFVLLISILMLLIEVDSGVLLRLLVGKLLCASSADHSLERIQNGHHKIQIKIRDGSQ
jgi:hypothetical protein